MVVVRILLLSLLGCALPLANARAADAAVFYRKSASLPVEPIAEFGGFAGKVLSRNTDNGRLALELQVTRGFRDRGNRMLSDRSFELLVLDGALQLGSESLGPRDFAYTPAGRERPKLTTRTGARVLAFFDPAPAAAEVREKLRAIGGYVTRYREDRWNPGSLSQMAGFDLKLEILHLKKDPLSGARTWLVRLAPPLKMPFEVHSVAEEAYVLAGKYSQPECMPDGMRQGVYEANDYFFRPGGIPHSGPGSGPVETTTFLMRTPANLDVVFYSNCAKAVPTQRVSTEATTRREVAELLAHWTLAANNNDWDGIADLMADDPAYYWAENGHLPYPDRAALLKGLELGKASGMKIGMELRDISITPLGSELANTRARYVMRLTPAPGAKPLELEGFFTATAVFRDRRWQFLQGHLSQQR
jgi:hypothetical protein